ncbi:Nuclear pore complex protein NUP93A [Ananas comosus]|uniref:Nuclear pore protein n=1 Tax=Ananas comosus TaxID=4615 RepID=A0A199VZG3_ANACO|nr:Nuclear pore complex protein NUP93A [Ananas comosus]
MANDVEMSGCRSPQLLHEAPRTSRSLRPIPPLQRSLDQLETLSTKLKTKTLRAETPSQSISATRLLAREGINAEQLARDLKSFELKTTFEDVFPSEATTVEEYLQQVHEMAMISAIQEAQKDNLRSFNDYMMKVLERRGLFAEFKPISTLPGKIVFMSSGLSRIGQAPSPISSPQVSTGPSVMEIVPPATAFRSAYESLTLMLLVEVCYNAENRHLIQAALGGAVGNLQKVRAFLRVRLRDYGVLDFDATDVRRQPPVDTTWQQIYFCLRTGYYDEARSVAQSSHVAQHFAPQLAEWISTGGAVSPETAISASEECEKMLRMGDRAGRPGYDRKRLLLYAIISGCRRQIDRLLRDVPGLFTTIEDFLWFKLSAVRDCPADSSSVVLSEGLVPYTLDDLQSYLNKYEPSYYTKNGKDPLVYPYVLLLSIQLLPAILYLSKEVGEEGYNIDAVHISIVLADHGVLSEGSGTGQKMGIMDACAEVASIIRQYGSVFLRHGNLELTLEYYAQAAAAMGGGEISWIGRGNADQQRQRSLMLRQLLTEILLRDGGIPLLLGPRGTGDEGELRKYMMDWRSREQFLLEAAHQCQEAGLYEKSIEIYKRVGAFATALETINKCLSDAICAMLRGRLDGDSRAAALIYSGNDVLETFKYSSEARLQDKELISEQQTVLRQLEAILFVHKLARAGQYVDALREITKLSFLPLNPRAPDVTADVFRNLSPHVQACVPDLLKIALSCIDNVADTDGTLRALKSKIANFVANNMTRNWPQDLYEKIARSI